MSATKTRIARLTGKTVRSGCLPLGSWFFVLARKNDVSFRLKFFRKKQLASQKGSQLFIMLIIFDFNRTLYDPDARALVPHAKRVLWVLGKRGHRLFLLSRKEPGRQNVFRLLGLGRYFSGSAFVKTKTKEGVSRIMRENRASPNETVVVGDCVKEEITCGNAVGARTVWMRKGKFADMFPRNSHEEPTYTVRSLREILKIIR